MAHLLRLMALALALCACGGAFAADDDVPQQSTTVCPPLPAGANPLDRMVPPGGTFYDGYEGIATPQTSTQCVQARVNPNYNPGWPPFWATINSYLPTTGTQCPQNSTENPASTSTPKTCSCNVGYVKSGSSCAASPNTCPAAGTDAGQYTMPADPANPMGTQNICGGKAQGGNNACGLTVVPTVSYPSAVPGSSDIFASGKATYTGQQCRYNPGGDGKTPDTPRNAQDANATAKPTPANCLPPKQFGTVNGVDVCLPAPTDKPVTTKTSTGTTTTSTDPTTGQPVTTTTDTSKTATCSGDTCTVTTTTTTTTTVGTGTPTTKTDTKTDTGVDKGGYCRQNPKDPVCVGTGTGTGNGSFSGTCTVEPVCTGDAVQCAIARSQFQENCTVQKAYSPDTDSTSVYNVAAAGNDIGNTDRMKADAAGSPVNVGQVNTSGRSWSRSCPADPSVDLPWAETQLTLPFSRLCGLLGVLVNGAVAISLLGAGMWVMGKRDNGE